LRLAAEYQSLRQRALATTRIAWNTRATQYTTVIAVLAAALFLVGFGLVVEGQIRRFTYVLGLVVGTVAIVWAAWLYHLPIPSTPDGAVSAAAEGAAKTMDGDFAGAVAAYDRAIAAAPGYAAPYTGRARARLLAANPDYPVSRAFTDRDGRQSEAAGRDARRGLELPGRQDVLAYAVAALEPFYRDDFAAARAETGEALKLNARIPDLWLLKSAAELGLGDSAAAGRSLAAALEEVRDQDPSERTRLLASTYLSYLSYVAWARPDVAPEARRLSNQVVARETAFTLGRPVSRVPPLSGDVRVLRLRYTAGRLTFTLRWRNLPARTALSVLGYERPLVNRAWSQPPDLALFAAVRGSGERRISVTLKRVCKPAAVRADVYLNGAPVLVHVGPGVPPTC
jgi:tetratricopeptide (TPR) repeat protein